MSQLIALGLITAASALYGFVVAHLASRRDSAIWSSSRDQDRLRIWVSEEEALEDLRDTADILKRLAYVLEEIPEWAGPQPRKRVERVETVVRVGRKSEPDEEGGNEDG